MHGQRTHVSSVDYRQATCAAFAELLDAWRGKAAEPSVPRQDSDLPIPWRNDSALAPLDPLIQSHADHRLQDQLGHLTGTVEIPSRTC